LLGGFGLSVVLVQPVCLVQHEENVLDALCDVPHELELVARDGRVASEHDDRRIDVRYEGACLLRVAREDGADTRRVDETKPALEE